MDAIASPPLGHNNPPDLIEQQREHLRESHTALIARQAELLGMEARLPERCEDDEWEAKLAEAVKACTRFTRNSETTRLDSNEPLRALIAATDGFFKALSDPIDRLKKKMGGLLTDYQREKADRERRRREEEARIAKAKADEEARLAREEAARVAEAKRREEAARLEAERIEREAREAADAEARRVADKAAAEARRAAEQAAAERREQERLAAEQRDRKAAAAEQAQQAKTSASAKAADMSRTRTDLGAVASLRTTFHFQVVDPDVVPRIYLSVHKPAITAAIRAATVNGECDLKIPGVRIYPVTDSVVR
jgi:hypothetical protein